MEERQHLAFILRFLHKLLERRQLISLLQCTSEVAVLSVMAPFTGSIQDFTFRQLDYCGFG